MGGVEPTMGGRRLASIRSNRTVPEVDRMQDTSKGHMTGTLGFVPQSAPQQRRYDIAIVGGGIVGLATARELLLRKTRLRLIVVEKDPPLAPQQSGHNTGRPPPRPHYPPASFQAVACA